MLYIFDYGAPVGLRLALEDPERVIGIISQNGNAYEEGLSDGWSPIQRYWRDPTDGNRHALRALLTPESIQWQYEHGVADLQTLPPDGYVLDAAYMARSGVVDIQLDLFGDLREQCRALP